MPHWSNFEDAVEFSPDGPGVDRLIDRLHARNHRGLVSLKIRPDRPRRPALAQLADDTLTQLDGNRGAPGILGSPTVGGGQQHRQSCRDRAPTVGTHRAYLRRFDIEHTFRFIKGTLGWTTPSLQKPEQADRWTWPIAATYIQLRLARHLVDDLRLPWERKTDPNKLTPVRV